MVFYRKYRPQTIQELDNQKLRTLLATVLSTDSFPHAFLFTGSKGLGKTSTARIVAKVVNCQRWIKAVKKEAMWKKEKLDTGEIPCNKCEQCVSITEGMNMDVLEIDGASNRGIDEIRDLREKIRLLPVMAEKKVYIIDEVHMLTTEAFNALLKTLEEPPAHAMFVLCTTEAHKVPDTIL
ncbi:MAG: AAA family ATPase, partial [Candidatus Levybacteria bacterium]|nr:AAA family ATPase [Candidatus Levybacteria bacterium]